MSDHGSDSESIERGDKLSTSRLDIFDIFIYELDFYTVATPISNLRWVRIQIMPKPLSNDEFREYRAKKKYHKVSGKHVRKRQIGVPIRPIDLVDPASYKCNDTEHRLIIEHDSLKDALEFEEKCYIDLQNIVEEGIIGEEKNKYFPIKRKPENPMMRGGRDGHTVFRVLMWVLDAREMQDQEVSEAF